MENQEKSLDDGKVFVLENLPTNYNEDLIIDYVEGYLNVDVKEVKVCPYIPGKALVFLPEKLEDYFEAQRIIAKAKVESRKVKLLPSSRKTAIVVNDLDIQKLSEELLCLYFECEFAEGSEVIKDSRTWPQFNMAVVYFHQDHKAVMEKILKNHDHVALPSENYHITVQPFYEHFHDCVGQQMAVSEVAEASIFKSLMIGQLNEESEREENVENDDAMAEDEVEDEEEDDSEEGEVEEKVENKCNGTSITRASLSHDRDTINTISSIHAKNQCKSQKELEDSNAHVKKPLEELNNRVEQSKICVETIKMTGWQKDLLTHCFENVNGCTVKFDKDEECAIIEGKNEPVKEHQLLLLKELRTLKEQILALTPAMYYILSKEQGNCFLYNLNSSSQLKGAKVLLHDQSLLVAAKDDKVLNVALDYLNTRMNFKETNSSIAQIPIDKLNFIKSKLEMQLLVKISWSDSEMDICVEGMKDDVFEAGREIKTLIEEYGIFEKSFTVDGLHAILFKNHFEVQIRQYLNDVEITEFMLTESHIDIKFQGDKGKANQAHKKLAELKTKVTQNSWDLKSEFHKPEDLLLITKGFNSVKMGQKVYSFELTHKCIITTNLPQLDSFIRKDSTTQQILPIYQNSSVASSKPEVPLKPSYTALIESDLKFKVTNTCQLIVKPFGDITKESSDILVCVLGDRVDLRKTRVGQSFNKLCPSLWKDLQDEHISHPDEIVLITKGNLKPLSCLAICHVILTPWNPNSSPTQLSDAIETIISQAVALGAKSISFPALGCGQAFGFPPSEVAKITCSSIRSSKVGNTVQKVLLLAPDRELFKEFKSEVPKHFQAIPIQVPSAVGSNDEISEEDDDELTIDLPYKLQDSNKAEITIVTLNESGLPNLWLELRKEIAKVCLHTHYYCQEIHADWPKKSREKIFIEAKKLCVWVEYLSPKTKKPGYIAKGEKQNVEKMIDIIKNEFLEFSSDLPKRRIKSNKAPKRGTVEFLRYASESDEQCPSYWKLNQIKHGIKHWLKKKIDKSKMLVSVDSKTKSAIEKLITSTWDPNLVGVGSDAKGLSELSYSTIEVIDIKRVENLQLFEPYFMQRKMIFKKFFKANKLCDEIGNIHGSKGEIETTKHLEDFMKEELYYEINEHYLFHGTKSFDAIINYGFDPKLSKGMFGKGTYTAEKFTKSDQYTDPKTDRTPKGTVLVMILARVLLGNVFLCDHEHESLQYRDATKLLRPPCMHCQKDLCNCKNQTWNDSIMGDGKWLFREFIVYDKNMSYPEYLIFYKRV